MKFIGWIDQFDDGNDMGVQIGKSQDAFEFNYGNAPILMGWMEELKTMKAKGKRLLIIPPELGYGSKTVKNPGKPTIPANSYLRFEIELVEVDNSFFTKFRQWIPKPSSLLE